MRCSGSAASSVSRSRTRLVAGWSGERLEATQDLRVALVGDAGSARLLEAEARGEDSEHGLRRTAEDGVGRRAVVGADARGAARGLDAHGRLARADLEHD